MFIGSNIDWELKMRKFKHVIKFQTEHMPGLGLKRWSYDESHPKWDELIVMLNRLNVIRWENDYYDPNILDGIAWQLSVQIPGFQRTVKGMNAYPEGFDELQTWVEENSHPNQ